MDDAERSREQNLITLMRRSAQAMVDELVACMVVAGYPAIRPAHSRVFETLDPAGSRISEMATRSQMTHQSMRELVASLEQQGYVEYRPDPRDRRAKLVCLTPAGRAMLRLSLAEIGRIETAWISRLRAHGIEGDLGAALAAMLVEDSSLSLTPAQLDCLGDA